MHTQTSLPTHVPTLHQMLLEQQQMIESLKEQLHRLLKHRFGPRSEVLDVSQSSLFADSSIVVELPQSVREAGWTQALPDGLGSHVRALQFIGGVPAAIVPDNLKSGVTRAHRGGPTKRDSFRGADKWSSAG